MRNFISSDPRSFSSVVTTARTDIFYKRASVFNLDWFLNVSTGIPRMARTVFIRVTEDTKSEKLATEA